MKGEAAPTVTEQAPALGISISVNLSQHHAITLQSHVANDEDPTWLVDKMTRQADRLIARYRIRDLKKNIEMNRNQVKNLVTDLARIDAIHKTQFDQSGRRGEYKLNSKQEAERNNALVTREKFEKLIADLEKELAEVEKEAQ